jgi:hypothetical protein
MAEHCVDLRSVWKVELMGLTGVEGEERGRLTVTLGFPV